MFEGAADAVGQADRVPEGLPPASLMRGTCVAASCAWVCMQENRRRNLVAVGKISRVDERMVVPEQEVLDRTQCLGFDGSY